MCLADAADLPRETQTDGDGPDMASSIVLSSLAMEHGDVLRNLRAAVLFSDAENELLCQPQTSIRTRLCNTATKTKPDPGTGIELVKSIQTTAAQLGVRCDGRIAVRIVL